MSISPIASNMINILSSDNSPFSISSDSGASAETFANILSDTLKTAAEADSADKLSGLQLLTGQSDDLSGLLLDAQKAELSLNLALQIRNKILDAYNEITRMSV